jgi:hypothetical protein
VSLICFGGANQIAGYRLYYMLRYAKKAGVRQLTLVSDGGFWIDEATDWLIDSGVDRVLVLVPQGCALAAPLARRVKELETKGQAAGNRPFIEVQDAPQENIS